MWRLIDALCSLYQDDDTEFITNWNVWMAKPRLYCVKSEWFDEMRYVPFEHMRIPVPGNYDEVLKIGDSFKE